MESGVRFLLWKIGVFKLIAIRWKIPFICNLGIWNWWTLLRFHLRIQIIGMPTHSILNELRISPIMKLTLKQIVHIFLLWFARPPLFRHRVVSTHRYDNNQSMRWPLKWHEYSDFTKLICVHNCVRILRRSRAIQWKGEKSTNPFKV